MFEVVLLGEVETGDAVTAAIDQLAADGPNLGRPAADRLKGSKFHNLKELRPLGTMIRLIFIFDPNRQAVILAAGDKTSDPTGWYRKNIPIAETRYQDWLDQLEG
ncbi:hypothetical protein D9V41_00510 [Aeromicrobium phragmitis]|uniref:Addiction module toxin RelE n=1 Tax=Aeromicrobium phragmitis TaxID=2478914 RepID=A0A3L8PP74_9ACTN|nr:type II toxin-antitoxin system RelE/ParE family toxin [Aeromicrobium phragmitis]RLV57177.1 hypothetical protein D9V41_00510 [Aeromicrobium phragmitis]